MRPQEHQNRSDRMLVVKVAQKRTGAGWLVDRMRIVVGWSDRKLVVVEPVDRRRFGQMQVSSLKPRFQSQIVQKRVSLC